MSDTISSFKANGVITDLTVRRLHVDLSKGTPMSPSGTSQAA
jgi:hypothetical protein